MAPNRVAWHDDWSEKFMFFMNPYSIFKSLKKYLNVRMIIRNSETDKDSNEDDSNINNNNSSSNNNNILLLLLLLLLLLIIIIIIIIITIIIIIIMTVTIKVIIIMMVMIIMIIIITIIIIMRRRTKGWGRQSERWKRCRTIDQLIRPLWKTAGEERLS